MKIKKKNTEEDWQIKGYEEDLIISNNLKEAVKNRPLGTLDYQFDILQKNYFKTLTKELLFYDSLKELIENHPNFFCFKKDREGQIYCFLTSENKNCYFRIIFRNMNTPLLAGEKINANFCKDFKTISSKEAVASLLEGKGFCR